MSTKVWRPEIPDRAGRGAHCSRINQIVKDIGKVRPGGPHEDAHETKRLLKRLDAERAKFHRLYGYKPPASETSTCPS